MRSLVIIAALLLSACASAPKAPVLKLGLSASQDANQFKNKPTGPVIVWVYELKAASSFEKADYFALYEDDKRVLGGDLLGKEEYKLELGDVIPAKEREIKPETRFIGAFVQFRDVESTQWRAILAVPSPGKKMWVFDTTPELAIRVEQRKVTVSVP